MASTTERRHVPHNPNNQGWPAAILTTAVVATLWCTAWYIHKTTYRHPMDPMFRAKGALEHGNSPMARTADGKPVPKPAAPAAGAAH